MEYTVREIQKKDNAQVEAVIRSCLIEFGADHEGTAWADKNLGRFSEVYSAEGSRYWVAVDADDKVVGGVGIGPLPGVDGVCELQKMYCLPAARGTGAAEELIRTALDFAARHYKSCYLETLDNMTRAHRFYEKHGFRRTNEAVGSTGHFACDVKYIREL